MKPLDSRAERSRAALLRAFIDLIFSDGFDRMSVSDIVAQAGTARSTFYEHFSSKEDILQASMAHFFAAMADCVSSAKQPVDLATVLAHFWGNRRMADAVFAGHSRLILVRSLGDLIERRLRIVGGGSANPALPYELAASHLAEGQLSLVESWLRGRAFCRSEDVATALYRSSRASALALLAGQ